MLKFSAPGGIFLLNSVYDQDEVWDKLPVEVQQDIIAKKLKFYMINANEVAAKTGMGGRVNTIMQTAFFAISGVLPRDQAIDEIKKAIKKTYGKRGEAVVKQNYEAVDQTLANLFEVKVPSAATSKYKRRPPVPKEAPDFVVDVLGAIIAFKGDELPVSAFPVDGTYPSATTRRLKIAPAAACVLNPARHAIRPIRCAKPSTWPRSRPCAKKNPKIGSISSPFPPPIVTCSRPIR